MTFPGTAVSDVRHHFHQLFLSRGAWMLAFLVLIIQALVSLAGGHDKSPATAWFERLGLSRDGFLSGEFWRIGSYGLLHGGWWHAGINAAFVVVIGSRIEHIVGGRMMLVTVLSGVLGGGLFHLLLGSGLLVGISGGCMAALLLLTTLSPESRMMPLPVSGRSLGLGILFAAGILALANPAAEIPGFKNLGAWIRTLGWENWFKMGHACHLGGGLAGWLIGRWVLRCRVTLASLRRERLQREARGGNRDGQR